MELVRQSFTVGQVVYAKIKGYPPWPAIITHMPTEKKARVQYFNSSEWNELSIKKLTPFHAGQSIEHKYLNRNGAFTKAFNEMHLVMEASSKKTKEKKECPTARIILNRLTPINIKKIQANLKSLEKPTKLEAKSRLRSGRLY